MVFACNGSKANAEVRPLRLNTRQLAPASELRYEPVMSQATKTTFGSCGLIVGMTIAPPPPGPMICHFPCPGSATDSAVARINNVAKRFKKSSVDSLRLPSFLSDYDNKRKYSVDLLSID